MIRAVLDANVIVSSILSPHGFPAKVLAAWHEDQFAVATSAATLAELDRVLRYPKLRQRHGWTPAQIRTFVADLAAITIPTPGALRLAVIRDDPSDNRYLECAVEAGADYLVSGDRHLLKLGTFRGIVIVTPGQFLSRLQSDPSA